MSWNKNSNSNPDLLGSLEAMVLETVLYFRNRGHRRDIAIEQGALALGLSPRKVKSIFYQEPVATSREEYDHIFLAFMRHLDAEAADYTRRAEAVKAKRRQMALGL